MKKLKQLFNCIENKYYSHYDGDHPVLRLNYDIKSSLGMKNSPDKNGCSLDLKGDATVPIMLILHIALAVMLTAAVCSATYKICAYLRCRTRIMRRRF